MRGGYGSAQLLPLLDPALMRRARKALIGYSDITALLALLPAARPDGDSRADDRSPDVEGAGRRTTRLRSRRVMMSSGAGGRAARRRSSRCCMPATATGVLVGGTLTQLVASLGTPWAFEPPHGCVLFLEDIGERPVPHPPDADAARAGGHVRARGARSSSASFPDATSPAASRRSATCCAISPRTSPGRCCSASHPATPPVRRGRCRSA